MNLDKVREKFKSGSWLKKLIGSKTYAIAQEVTEHIFYKLEGHDRDIAALENKILSLESDVRRLESKDYGSYYGRPNK